MMKLSLKAQRLANYFLGQFVELLSVFAPHLRSIHVGATFVVGLWGDRCEGSKVKDQNLEKGDLEEPKVKAKV